MDIVYVKGDATQPAGKEPNKIIAHICNDAAKWGAGFVNAISEKWPMVEKKYRDSFHDFKPPPQLGNVLMVMPFPNLLIANMIAQHGVGRDRQGKPPIRYDALERCLIIVARWARNTQSTVHMPRIGCGLAGGSWDMVEPIIERTLTGKGVRVTVYDL